LRRAINFYKFEFYFFADENCAGYGASGRDHIRGRIVGVLTGGSPVTTKATIAVRLTLRRGLDQVEAAVYLSLSQSKFRQVVMQGTMPRPRLAGRRRIWGVDELDQAFRELPRVGGDKRASSWAGFK
jgi:hypothetical protein